MFRRNDQHLQWPLRSDLDALPPKLKARLEASWAGSFYREIFVRLDEKPFAVLYSDEASRPNSPINVLVGLETLKSGFGWSDEEMDENFCLDPHARNPNLTKLQGRSGYRLRVGGWRVIYELEDDQLVILVLKIAS